MNERPEGSIGVPVREVTYRTDAKNIYFVSSSGHCSLDCSYCIVNPIAKHQPSLAIEDLEFLFEARPGKSLMMFSGTGDFFAGYKKNDRFLEKLLDHDVEIALDINGVMIHEYGDLPPEKLAKIRYINLTMHYRQLLDHRAATVWARNAVTIATRQRSEMFVVGYIVTPQEVAEWGEALAFYRSAVFAKTGQRIVLVKDIYATFDATSDQHLAALQDANHDMIEEVHQEDFAARFARYPYVICPAGVSYFRIWHDGRVEGCPYIEARRECGNLKERRLAPPREDWIECSTPNFCDCSAIAITGNMHYPEADQATAAAQRTASIAPPCNSGGGTIEAKVRWFDKAEVPDSTAGKKASRAA